MQARWPTIAGLALLCTLLAAPASGSTTPTPRVAAPHTHRVGALLRDIPVRAERNAGYDRAKFNLWIDADGDGCDTRDEVLIAEAVHGPQVGSGCDVGRGLWLSRYDRLRVHNPSNLDIDHMVPLAEAWGSGARRWTANTRQR
jgi:hypothetical protein